MAMRLRMMAAALTVGTLVALGTAAPANAAPADEPEAIPLTAAEVEAEVAAIPDETARALVAAHVNDKLAAGAELYGVSYNTFKQKASGGVTTMAYPSGCGLTVLISRTGQKIENDSITSCSSAAGMFTSLKHFSDIVAYHGVTRWPKVVKEYTFSRSAGYSYITTLAWTCANYNLTSYNVRTTGHMYKGATLYYTPIVYDTFGGNINCGY